ncbi:hypothetical protein [Pseudoxanthomonas sp. UTMC 1351]
MKYRKLDTNSDYTFGCQQADLYIDSPRDGQCSPRSDAGVGMQQRET